MKKVIVTGANGFVGSAVVSVLIKNDIEVIAIDMPERNNNLPKCDKLTFIGMDIKNIKELANMNVTADTFYHFAWIGSAGEGRFDTELQLNNAQWTIECMRIAKEIGCNRFIPAGSIMEYETIASSYSPGNRPGLGYIYGAGKLVSHAMSVSVANDIGIDIVSPKITNAYGPGELSPRFVNSTIRKIINNEPLEFTSGTQNYDFVYIDDVAEAFYLIGEKGKPFNEYIIGSSSAQPLKNFILEMQKSIAPKKCFIFGEIPYTGTNLSLESFNCQKTEDDTGFRAKVSFEEGTKRTMEWIMEIENNG